MVKKTKKRTITVSAKSGRITKKPTTAREKASTVTITLGKFKPRKFTKRELVEVARAVRGAALEASYPWASVSEGLRKAWLADAKGAVEKVQEILAR